MSNVFEKAVEIAQRRAAWEAKINPEGAAIAPRPLTAAEQAESQKQIDAFKAAIVAAAKKGGFENAAAAKVELDKLDHDSQYEPLWKMSEMCVPVTPETMAIAQALAPSRVGTVALIKAGKFGVYEASDESAAGVRVHLAGQKAAPRQTGEAAREAKEQQSATQLAAFNEISGAIGSTIKGAKPGKVSDALKSLDKLGGVRVVEGERHRVAAVGQGALFDEETAPMPKGAAKRKPKAGK